MKKYIVLCADDYGQASSISAGILKLCEMQRLSAVSCMTNSDSWQEDSRLLHHQIGHIDIGLHFNLTHGKPLTSAFQAEYGIKFPTLARLMLLSLSSQLKEQLVIAECHAQLDTFESGLQLAPNFLDGHQHIHQFPVIRNAILKVYASRLRQSGCYLRLARFTPFTAGVKGALINLLGGNACAKLYKKNAIRCNTSFAGAYSFSKAAKYAQLFRGFLKQSKSGGLIMCHPGFRDATDDIAYSRPIEFAYFQSAQFLHDCAQENIKIARFQEAFIV